MIDELPKQNEASAELDGEPCDMHLARALTPTSESALAPEPFPIVEFSKVETDAIRQDAVSPWTWGVLVYGTNSNSRSDPLCAGDVVTLDERVGAPVRLMVHGEFVAEGMLVRENQRVGLRISRVVSRQQSPQQISKDVVDDAA